VLVYSALGCPLVAKIKLRLKDALGMFVPCKPEQCWTVKLCVSCLSIFCHHMIKRSVCVFLSMTAGVCVFLVF